MSDDTEHLWITLVLIQAKVLRLDMDDVPECVLQAYAQRDMSVGQAIAELFPDSAHNSTT